MLKIDQSFVRRMTQSQRGAAMMQGIAALAHALNLKIIAEGIETPQQRQLLRAMGCHFGQGFGLGKPISLEQLVTGGNLHG